MSDPYEKAKGGRLAFKGGALASRSKAIDKKKKKKKKAKEETVIEESAELELELEQEQEQQQVDGDGGTGEIYTIDAAKRRKYDDLFPVEAKKFGYDPKAKSKSVEEALDDRVTKKADRYCK